MKLKKPTLVFASLLFSVTTLACPFHMNMQYDDNSSVLPGTMQLNLAGMFAEQTGIINPVKHLEGTPAYQRASWWLTLFSRKLEKQGVKGVNLLLADVPLWAHYGTPHDDLGNQHTIKLEVDITPPDNPTNTIMLTHLSLQAIVEGKISIQEALENNLIIIHQDKENIKYKLLNG